MAVVGLIYPHQCAEDPPAARGADQVWLVEEPLFFRHYRFHLQKLVLHRATMAALADALKPQFPPGAVRIIPSQDLTTTADIVPRLHQAGATKVQVAEPTDDYLTRRLTRATLEAKLPLAWLPDDHFLTSAPVMDQFVQSKKKLFFTDFYIQQRKRLGLLLDDDGGPLGGKWSYDTENRKKLPETVSVPRLKWPKPTPAVTAACASVAAEFGSHYGQAEPFQYPTTPQAAKAWLKEFLRERLPLFGDYEDAISSRGTVLFHGLLTPMMNTGLLRPVDIIQETLRYQEEVPLNSLEGFLRQIMGWREFIRLVYRAYGRQQRTRNFWQFSRPMPPGCYDGTTGLPPVDRVIQDVLRTGYCHHIERLMILGNFFLLCEIHPDAVYQWFMELFIDAYDWVMVPNVYGMSQHADGGLMTTKPYISGSAYVLKMSDHKKGAWCPIWDALYWRFIDRQSGFFAGNPRMSMMVAMKNKLGSKLKEHHRTAEAFLNRLDAGRPAA